MSILLIQACFYFSYRIIEQFRLQGTSGGHLFHSCIAEVSAFQEHTNQVSFVR